MTSYSTVFFCDVLGRKVFAPDGKTIGRLKDLVADVAFTRPRIVAAVVGCPDGLKTLDIAAFSLEASGGGRRLVCREIKLFSPGGEETVNIRQLLNTKVVDMDKRSAVPVYDVKIAFKGGRPTVIAVDAGMQGRLRQLRLQGIAQRIARLLSFSIPSRLVLWDNVEAISVVQAVGKLSRSMPNLNRLHSSEMADIMEEMDSGTQAEIFSAMDAERAADVLEELEPGAQDRLLESLPSGRIADVLEIMPADEVADILDEVGRDKAEELLNEMDSSVSGEVRELMEYDDGVAGSLMMKDYVCLRRTDTAGAVLEMLRGSRPGYDIIYYLYVVSETGALEAAVSLRDLLLADPDTRIEDIMNRAVICARDTDRIDSLNDIIAKYSLLAVPVVDANRVLLGTVIINDAFFRLLRARRRLL